jgi:hypothetical protein
MDNPKSSKDAHQKTKMLERKIRSPVQMVDKSSWRTNEYVNLARASVKAITQITNDEPDGGDVNSKMTDYGDLSAISVFCSCANECCPVAVPIFLGLSYLGMMAKGG